MDDAVNEITLADNGGNGSKQHQFVDYHYHQ